MRAFVLATSFALLIGRSGAQDLARHEFESAHMGTVFRIVLYGSDSAAAEGAAGEAFAHAGKLDAIFSDYEADSELMRLVARREAVVSPELFEVLALGIKVAQQTGGVFDITTGAHTRNWRRARVTGELPTEKQIAAAKAASGWKKLRLDPKTRRVTLAGGMFIDLGGIAKGYAADAMLERLRRSGFPIASVAAGGDIAVGDPPPGESGWTIAISPGGEAHSGTLELANGAISTSGDAEQWITIGGKRYSHIVDPETGLGLTQSCAVSVIAKRGRTADPLATALSVMGKKKGTSFANQCGIRVRWGGGKGSS